MHHLRTVRFVASHLALLPMAGLLPTPMADTVSGVTRPVLQRVNQTAPVVGQTLDTVTNQAPEPIRSTITQMTGQSPVTPPGPGAGTGGSQPTTPGSASSTAVSAAELFQVGAFGQTITATGSTTSSGASALSNLGSALLDTVGQAVAAPIELARESFAYAILFLAALLTLGGSIYFLLRIPNLN